MCYPKGLNQMYVILFKSVAVQAITVLLNYPSALEKLPWKNDEVDDREEEEKN